jgi:Tfp pilus assembly protein PilP
MTRHVCVSMLACAALAGGPAARPSAAANQAPVPVEAPRPDDTAPAYAYESHGRRDPFVSLVARGRDPRVTGSRPPGVAGLLIGEVTVRGVVQDRSGFIAMIQGPDRKTFIVRAGEVLLDGSIKAITGDAIVFAQDVADPLATVKQKEVRKSVRPADDGRP